MEQNDNQVSVMSNSDSHAAHLLNWTLCLEEDTSSQQFSKNTANTPDIHCSRIVARSHQNFWRSVVLRHYFLGHVF